jgi:hypothetical protein
MKGLIGLCCIFVFSLILLTPRLHSGDEVQYFAFLHSAWKDHDLRFLNEYDWLYRSAPAKQVHFKQAFIDRLNATGYARNDAPIGCAILWAPFFAMADVYVKVSGSFPADGFSFPYILMTCFASAFYGFLGFVLQYQIAKKYFGDWDAFAAVLTTWFGTQAVFYMYVTPPMSHATSIFTTSLFLFCWFRVRESDATRDWLLLGALGGLAAMVRWQDALFLLIPLLDRNKFKFKIVVMIGAVLVFLPQFFVWKILNGELNPYSTGNLKGKFFWYGKYFIPVLFSTYHGLLIWTPVIALCAFGFYYLIKRDRLFWLPVLVVLAQFYSIICLDTWQGGAGFGLRYITSCTAIFTLGLAALYHQWKRKLVVSTVSLLFIVWNLFMVIQASTGMIPRDGHFPISVMLRNQFVEVPRRIGDIAYRYLFHRSSFYGDEKVESKP